MLTPVTTALDRLATAIVTLPAEMRPLSQARGAVLAEPARAAIDLPRFNQSAVDGYALRHAEIGAPPAELPLTGHIAATVQKAPPVLPAAAAMRILTGGLLPLGADTVVRQEKTAATADRLTLREAVPPGADIRWQGEECRAGEVIAPKGRRLGPGMIGALAMAGIEQLQVHRRPRIVLLITGDELATPGEPLAPGQIPDANGPLLKAWLEHWQLPPLALRRVPDRPEAVLAAIDQALDEADVVLSTGGVSVGDHDHVPAAAEAVGARRLLWKVAQKPGMPLYIAQRDGHWLFGLPGNPASVLCNLLVYVRPTLEALQGLDSAWHWPGRARPGPGTPAPQAQKVRWLRGQVRYGADGPCEFIGLGGQSSHMLGNLAEANALAWLPPGEGLPATLAWQPL